VKESTEIKCCDNQMLVYQVKQVIFEVDNAAHLSKKSISFTVYWCVNCKKMTSLIFTEL
jgi:thiol:disulfide interchange protein